jgi:hypothetical protein
MEIRIPVRTAMMGTKSMGTDARQSALSKRSLPRAETGPKIPVKNAMMEIKSTGTDARPIAL